MGFTFHLDDGELLFVSFHFLGSADVLCLAAKAAGKGRYLNGAPKGWRIRKDPEGDAFEGQPEHYHCERDSDGTTIVITVEGHASHKSNSGDKVPKTLGEYLEDELGIPVARNDDGGYVLRLVCGSVFEAEIFLQAFVGYWFCLADEIVVRNQQGLN